MNEYALAVLQTHPTVADVSPSLVRVDAHAGFAAPALAAGRDLLVHKAKAQGVAALALHRCRHFHALWWEVEALANEVCSMKLTSKI